MQKENFLSKLSRKDYESRLEDILEKKYFSTEAKNLLLRTFYKVDVNYEDYQKVKRTMPAKDEWMKSFLYTVANDCDNIYVIAHKEDANEKTEILKREKKDAVVDISEKEIIIYDKEEALIEQLSFLSHKGFNVNSKYPYLCDCLEETLKIGDAINSQEVIRDFNGWSWVVHKEQLKDLDMNLIYQIILILVGFEFLEKWKRDTDLLVDYIEELKTILIVKYGNLDGKRVYNLLIEIILKFHIMNNLEFKNKVIEEYNIAKTEIAMENSEEVLLKASEEKKKLIKQIMDIDTILNDKNKLEKEFLKRNKTAETKVFKLETFSEILKRQKQGYYKKINILNQTLDPKEYLKRKDIKDEKVRVVESYNLLSFSEEDYQEDLKELQIAFLECLKIEILRVQTKKEITDYIYILRYYNNMLYKKGKVICKISELESIKQEVEDIKFRLIDVAYKKKIIYPICANAKQNDLIVSKIFETNMIELTNVEFKVVQNGNLLEVELYDRNNLEATFQVPILKDKIELRLNRKIRLFI